MSKSIKWTALVAVGILLAGGAAASGEIFENGNLRLTADGQVKPNKLPKKKRKPVKLLVSGSIATKDGTTPPIARKAILDFDKNGGIYAKGKPKCKPQKLVNQRTKQAVRRCKKSLIGAGSTEAIIDFPDQEPFVAEGPLKAFLGKKVRGHQTVIFHVFANVPAPTAFVVPVIVKEKAPGRKFGIRTITEIPTISGGNGRLSSFNLKLNKKWKHKGKVRRFATARCKNGRFLARAKLHFQDHPTVGGSLVRRCKKK